LGINVTNTPITSVTWLLTIGEESLHKIYNWGIIKANFSGDTNLINLAKLCTAVILTSLSTSFNKLLNIWISEVSEISFPIASANSANILLNDNLTLHDLSSAD